MPTEKLSPGPVSTLLQNVVYAMPSSRVYLVASAALQFSLSPTSGFGADVAASTTGMESAWPFVRCVTGNATVSIEKA